MTYVEATSFEAHPDAECLDVLVAVGTRPEAIKMLPVILALRASRVFRPVVLSTGQHPEMVADVLNLGGVSVDSVLCEGANGGGLNGLFPAVMVGFEQFCNREYGSSEPRLPHAADLQPGGRPCAVLVHGDTTSALAVAMAAFHMRIPVVHVEAGLRTGGSVLEPFPEEMNRQAISRIACLHFAPTRLCAENLIREGVPYAQVMVTGNTAIDALMWALSLELPIANAQVEAIVQGDRRVVAVTAHRRESWGGGLARVAEAIKRLAQRYPEVEFVVAVHPNPLVKRELGEPLAGLANVTATPPLGYLDFARLMERCELVITDSGGLQEEAPALNKPVLVTRDATERNEGLLAGTLELVGSDSARIEASAARLLDDPGAYAQVARARNPYGDGRAASRVVAALSHLRGVGSAAKGFGSHYDPFAVLQVAGFGQMAEQQQSIQAVEPVSALRADSVAAAAFARTP